MASSLMNSIDPNGNVVIRVGSLTTWQNSLTLPANPDQQITLDIRVSVLQTVNGLNINDYGLGLQTLQLSGTTALMSPIGRFDGLGGTSQFVDGPTAAKLLYAGIIGYYFAQEEQGNTMRMKIHDFANKKIWLVKPITNLQTQQTQQSPYTVYYTASFLILSDNMGYNAMASSAPDTVLNIIGNVSTRNSSAQTTANGSSTSAQAPGANQPPSTAAGVTTQYSVPTTESLFDIAQSFINGLTSNSNAATIAVNDLLAANPQLGGNANSPIPAGTNLNIPQQQFTALQNTLYSVNALTGPATTFSPYASKVGTQTPTTQTPSTIPGSPTPSSPPAGGTLGSLAHSYLPRS